MYKCCVRYRVRITFAICCAVISLYGGSRRNSRDSLYRRECQTYKRIITQPISHKEAVHQLTYELSQCAPNHERCVETLMRPITTCSCSLVNISAPSHTKKQLQIVGECAKHGICVPLRTFKKAVRWHSNTITQSWKYAVLISAMHAGQVSICRQHPKIGELDGETKWNILEDAVRWNSEQWKCLLYTNFFNRMPADTVVYHDTHPPRLGCRNRCRVCNVIRVLHWYADALSNQSRHRYMFALRRMMQRKDIHAHTYCPMISRSMIAFRGDIPKETIEREQYDITMSQKQQREYTMFDVVGQEVVSRLRAYANGCDPYTMDTPSFSLQKAVPETGYTYVNPGVYLEQLLTAYRARVSKSSLAHFVYETRSSRVWDHIIQATYTVCPEALLTRLHGHITPLHYIAAISEDSHLLARMYLTLRKKRGCPQLYFPTANVPESRGLMAYRRNSISLYKAAADTNNVRMQHDTYWLYKLLSADLPSVFSEDTFQHIYQFGKI